MSRTTGGDGYVREASSPRTEGLLYAISGHQYIYRWPGVLCVRPPVHVPVAWCTLCEATSTCTGGLVYFV